MKKLCVASNMYNEIDQLPEWYDFVKEIADGGILVVDSGSTDGTQEWFEDHGVIIFHDDIIRREGYGPARNQLRRECKKYFPESHWCLYLDADERILPCDFHKLKWYKDYLINDYDVVALPRIDWIDKEMTKMAKDWVTNPDWQARMSRLNSPVVYIRKLHEQITGFKAIFTSLNLPKINHFHRSSKDKRDLVGKLCAKLHAEDSEYGHTYPKHHKEEMYYEQYKKEGL
uniref:Putative glycosyltransferase n=1 Tax=viral metagenome TaxID=1070528 RepID=A0A6M3J936_9ZZZZ